MKILIIALLVSLSNFAFAEQPDVVGVHREVSTQSPALLCADQADNRIRLIGFTKEGRSATLWCYPAQGEKQSDYKPTDAKRVEMDGEVHVLAAYHGRVRLVRFRDCKLVKDYPTYGSCHSAELLPDGSIVSVSSNDGILRLHHSADEFVDLKLPYGHGVTWDKTRKRLWVLGDRLYRFAYDGKKLSPDGQFKLPLSPTGHDLFPLRDRSKLLASNNDALFLFDIAKEEFETVSTLKEIKSASQHVDGSIWVTEPKKIEGAADWQSDSIVTVLPERTALRHSVDGARFYKARWWQ